MSSNYPPGVSGNEPQITGEWPVDPHAPFVALGDGEAWIVQFGNDEDHFFEPNPSGQHEAESMALALNLMWGLREENPDSSGICRICGEPHNPPEGA